MHLYNNMLVDVVKAKWFECFGPVIENDKKIEEIKNPPFLWTGVKFPLTLMNQVINFFVYVNEKHKGEAQVRLIHYDDGRLEPWDVLVNKQEVAGAATRETESLPLPVNAVEIGTIHSHPTFAAFQSGTDKNDEHRTNGIHITIGKVDSRELDWHARAYYQGVEHELNWPSFLDFGFPSPGYNCLAQEALKHLRRLLPVRGFPEAWIDQIVERTYSNIPNPVTTGWTPGWQNTRPLHTANVSPAITDLYGNEVEYDDAGATPNIADPGTPTNEVSGLVAALRRYKNVDKLRGKTFFTVCNMLKISQNEAMAIDEVAKWDWGNDDDEIQEKADCLAELLEKVTA